MAKVLVEIEYEPRKLEELNLSIEDEVTGWIESNDTGVFVNLIKEIEL